MQTVYEGPEDLVEKMKSLSLSQDCSLGGECKRRRKAPQFNHHRWPSASVTRNTNNKSQAFLLDVQIVRLHW